MTAYIIGGIVGNHFNIRARQDLLETIFNVMQHILAGGIDCWSKHFKLIKQGDTFFIKLQPAPILK